MADVTSAVVIFGGGRVGRSSATTTAGSKLVFHVFGALAEFERSIIRERTKAGLEAARARGRTGGRPPSLTDKDLAGTRALLPDPAITMEEAARRLKVAPSTLYRHLPGGRGALMDGGLS